MPTDRYGNSLSTSSIAARDAYVEGVDLIFAGDAGTVEAFERGIAADPGFALAHIGKARSLQLRGDVPAGRAAMEEANKVASGLSSREASHMAFYNLVLSGQGDAAITAAKEHLKAWPRDAMVLSPCTSVFGLIGFSGRAGREREQVALLDGLATHYGDDWWFNCQHAFALDETGQRDAARPKIEQAMEQFPRNAHGAHIRAHVYYEDGALADARTYLIDWLKTGYSRQGQLHCHLHWHLALCHLALGEPDKAWALYDGAMDPPINQCAPIIAIADAASFLWRAELAGGTRDAVRWRTVHAYGHEKFPKGGVAFADMHILLADAVSGDVAGLEARVRDFHDLAKAGRLPTGPMMPALATAWTAFLRGDWNSATSAIEPILAEHERVGGSRAQRDLIEFTLLKAYANAGRTADLRRMLAQRRPGPGAVPVAGLH